MKKHFVPNQLTPLLVLLIFIPSCNEQNTPQAANSTLNDQNSTIAIGDTVSELGKSIWIIFQDKNNHYWFGSDGQGVYRYDGKTIIHFTTRDGLSNDRIRGIQEDKLGNVFITSLDGINKFDGHKFTTLPVIESNEWKLDPNDLWFYWAYPFRYDGKSLYRLKFPKHHMEDEFYAVNGKRPWSSYDVYTIYKDSKGNIWFGTSNLGVCRYDGKSFNWFSENGMGETPVRSVSEDKNGNFWFGNSSQGVYCYDGKSLINFREEKGIGNIKGRQEDDHVSYNSIIKDNKDELWIATYQAGVWRYDGENVTYYPVKDGDKTINLIAIYKDNQGDLWLGTQEEGVYKFNGKTFERFNP